MMSLHENAETIASFHNDEVAVDLMRCADRPPQPHGSPACDRYLEYTVLADSDDLEPWVMCGCQVRPLHELLGKVIAFMDSKKAAGGPT